MTKKQMIKVAKLEIKAWRDLPDGLVMVILWAYIEHLTSGQPIEETFFGGPAAPDYEI